jgi:acetate---CoA ligase (ADP-forming)
MTDPHPLTALLAPRSVAIFGASNDPERSGRPLRYFLEAGYSGALYPINPNRDTVQGVPAFPDLASVPGPVEFALIAVPATLATSALEASIAKGVRAVVMFTAGFAETGEEGRVAQERLAEIARSGGVRLCGPNCLGLFNLRTGHTPTFGSYLEEGRERPGPLGMVTQSRALGTHLLALAKRRGILSEVWISTGNEADIQVADGISFLADDPQTEAIACYMEAIKDRDRFIEAVTCARTSGKPIVAMKVGGSAVGAAAAASHTASLAGSDAVYDAAFRQLGVERAVSPEDLIEIAYACTRGRLPRSRRLAVMTVSGGAGVLLADAAEREGVELTPLSSDAQALVLSWVPFAAARNPVDLTAQPLNEPALIDKGFDLLLGQEEFPAIAAFFLLWASSPKLGEILFESVSKAPARYPDRYFALSVIAREEVRRRYEEAGVAIFEDPWSAVEAVAAAMRCAERLARPPVPLPLPLEGLPPPPDGRIGEAEAERILARAGIPSVEERLVTSPRAAAEAAATLGDQLVLKILSPDILHKTEAGGVLLDGIFVEVMRDLTFRIAPFDTEEARRMIGEVKGAALLEGARGIPPADIDALAEVLSRLSRFAGHSRAGSPASRSIRCWSAHGAPGLPRLMRSF